MNDTRLVLGDHLRIKDILVKRIPEEKKNRFRTYPYLNGQKKRKEVTNEGQLEKVKD